MKARLTAAQLSISRMPDLKLVRLLRGVFAASILIPLALFAIVAWEGHREIYRDAERAILRQTAILYEHASKVLQAQELVIEQANDRIRGLPWAEIRSSAHGFTTIKSDVGAGTTVSIFMRKGAGMRGLDEMDAELKAG